MKNLLKLLSLFLLISCTAPGIEPLKELHYFAMVGDIEEVKRLLDEGEDIHLVNRGDTALNLASHEGQAKMVSFLISRGADPNNGGQKGSPLYNAKNVEVARILLDNGADINFKTKVTKSSPLNIALRFKKTKLALFLIEQNADIHHITAYGSTAILYAVQYSQNKVAKVLFEKGANPYIENRHGISAYSFLKEKIKKWPDDEELAELIRLFETYKEPETT